MATTDWVVIFLMDCVVFSRATRAACARYVLDDSSIATYLAALGGGELGGRKVNRPSLFAVLGPIRQQSTPNWKNDGSMVLLDKCRSVIGIRQWQPVNVRTQVLCSQ